jgi:hypothetical protein
MKIVALVLLVSLASPLSAAEKCGSASSCNTLGTKELQAGRFKQAIEAFETQAGYAEEADREATNSNASLIAYNNLVLAELKAKNPLMAKAWLSWALEMDPQNKAALFNRKKVDEAMQGFVYPEKVTGTYQRYAGAGTWDDLDVAELPGGKIRFSFTLVRMGMNWRQYGAAAIGELSGTVALKNGSATYEEKMEGEDKPCVVKMKFERGKVTVDQAGSDIVCGFGAGVSAGGTFYMTSTKEPAPPKAN